MTTRDIELLERFAGYALSGLLANPGSSIQGKSTAYFDEIAQSALSAAEAMVNALDKRRKAQPKQKVAIRT